MKKLILSVMAALISQGAAAGEYNCTSVGERLPKNRIEIHATLKTNWLGAYTGGTYQYDSGSGEFVCAKPNDKRVVICGLVRPDPNILSVAIHPVVGLMFEVRGQDWLALFSCN